MPASVNYLTQLKNQLVASSNAKRAAYDAALQRATTATFDDKGRATYKKDEAANPMYGTLDVQYMNQKRGIETAGEASGTLRSGQQARNLAEAFANYRQATAAAQEAATSGKNQTSLDQALQAAEYEAMYGATTTPRTGTARTPGNRPPVGGNKSDTDIPPPPTKNDPRGPMGQLGASIGPVGPQGPTNRTPPRRRDPRGPAGPMGPGR